METKNLKINVPNGYEIDKELSTFENIVFKKIEYGKQPRTWEEYCKLTKGETCVNLSEQQDVRDGYVDEFDTMERMEEYAAIGQLMQLRDYWVRGYTKMAKEYTIYITRDGDIGVMTWHNKFMKKLTFPTEAMAKDFINCFRDLIKTAYMH